MSRSLTTFESKLLFKTHHFFTRKHTDRRHQFLSEDSKHLGQTHLGIFRSRRAQGVHSVSKSTFHGSFAQKPKGRGIWEREQGNRFHIAGSVRHSSSTTTTMALTRSTDPLVWIDCEVRE